MRHPWLETCAVILAGCGRTDLAGPPLLDAAGDVGAEGGGDSGTCITPTHPTMILTRPTAASQLVITPAHLFFKDQRTQAGVFDTWEVERTGLCGVQVERLASTDSWWPGGDDWPARAAGNIMEMEYWGSNGVYRRSTYARASEQAEVFTTLAFTFLIRKDVVYLTPSVKEGVYALPASGGQPPSRTCAPSSG